MKQKATMASTHFSKPESLIVGIKEEEEGDETQDLYQPMSPSSQCLNTSVLSLCIIAVAESEIPIIESKILATLKNDLLRANSRFSSVVVIDPKGFQWWKRVDVLVENHVVIPSFPLGLSKEDYTLHFKKYLSKVSQEPLPVKQPLWEMHIFKYPTSTSAETLIFKMHHALGDGFSIMGGLFSCLKRAENPELPLTFPSSTTTTISDSGSWLKSSNGSRLKTLMEGVSRFVSGCWNTTTDFASSVLRSTLLEDDRTVIRSGMKGVEFLPIEITTVGFSLDDIRQVKLKVGGSVNDVVVGLIFNGIHLYNQAMGSKATSCRRTALVLLNTRMVKGYRSIEDMLEKNMWGNHFSFIHLSVPTYGDQEKIDPLKFIFNAKKIIQRNRNSMSIYLNSVLLRLVGSLSGTEAISHYVHSTLQKASVTITNLAGPVEKMAIAEHPIRNIYFSVSGSPQSLLCSVLSYMGKLTLVLTTEKGFIDSQLLVTCMKEAFEKIFEASCGKETGNGK